MKYKLCFVLLGISTMLGCAHLAARFYPVQGPMSAQVPQPVLIARISGNFAPGDISVVLPDGEVCKGRWKIVNPTQAPKGSTTGTAPASDMAPVWDSIYGPGYYVARVLGTRYYAQTVATGNRGTILNAEMFSEPTRAEGSTSIKGVARDNQNNIYKMVVDWER